MKLILEYRSLEIFDGLFLSMCYVLFQSISHLLVIADNVPTILNLSN